MIVRKLRLQRGWSQDQLAEFTGLSVRTIQRIERGQRPSLESSKAPASVFEVDISTFIPEDTMMEPAIDTQPNQAVLKEDERAALNYAKNAGVDSMSLGAAAWPGHLLTVPDMLQPEAPVLHESTAFLAQT